MWTRGLRAESTTRTDKSQEAGFDVEAALNEAVSNDLAQMDAAGNYLKKAASLGFEPRQRDPESLVLPLHYEAKLV